jgi:hypothetical protein
MEGQDAASLKYQNDVGVSQEDPEGLLVDEKFLIRNIEEHVAQVEK